jgi:hypothetical protein
MSPKGYTSNWAGIPWDEYRSDNPYEIRHNGDVMARSHEKHRAMRVAMALQAGEGGTATVTNTDTDVVILVVTEEA